VELTELIKKLAGFSIKLYGKPKKDYDLQTARLYEKGLAHYASSTLYLASTENLPEPAEPSEFVLFCYGAPISFSVYADSSFTLAYLGECQSPNALMNLLLEHLTEVHQITAGIHIMVNALFSDKGLQNLIDTAAQIFDNPIYLVDLQGKYLAISSGISTDNEFFLSETKRGYISDEGMQFIRRNKIDEKVRTSEQPYYFFNPLISHGTLIGAVCIQDIEVGHLMLQESNHPMNEYDPALFQRFARLVAMELQKSSFFSDNRGVMYSYFLADLLRDSPTSSASIKERLSTLGYHMKEDIYLMVIPSSCYHNSDLRTEIIIQNLRIILSGSLYVIYEGDIVFLISKEKKQQGFGAYETDRLTSFLSGNNLKAGISNYFTDLSNAPRFYKQASTAVSLGIRLNKSGAIYYYRDYYIFEMLKIYEKTDHELQFLIHPGLMRLYEYDQERGGEFMATLKEYLLYPGQPSKVAANLHIHKNTLLYRIGKIKKITHCDFNTGDDYMFFGLSFKIMEYLQMI